MHATPRQDCMHVNKDKSASTYQLDFTSLRLYLAAMKGKKKGKELWKILEVNPLCTLSSDRGFLLKAPRKPYLLHHCMRNHTYLYQDKICIFCLVALITYLYQYKNLHNLHYSLWLSQFLAPAPHFLQDTCWEFDNISHLRLGHNFL